MQALRKLGLADKVLASAHQVDEIIYANKKGKTISQASLHLAPLNQDKFVALLRSRLQDILSEQIIADIHFETEINSFNSDESGVTVSCSNPSLSGHYDLVVSAEGIHSSLRKRCFPHKTTTVCHNISNWRFLVDYPQHGLQPSYFFARSELFMLYPISPDALYCYAHVYDADSDYRKGDPQHDLQQLFGQFGGEVPNILKRLDPDSIISSHLQSVDKPYYAKDGIVFIGDAGNACSPLLQQGAASAFEDALCLANQCQQYPIQQAVQEYQRIRAPRVEWVLNHSDIPIQKIKMMRSPLGAFIRNMLFRSKGPLNVYGWKQLAEMP
jgi:2-polyprenyl-6-methoxyphenol hydroxylase-like FAD-dependent oxidoreductase